MRRLVMLLAITLPALMLCQDSLAQNGLLSRLPASPFSTRTPQATGENFNPFFNPEVPTLWHQLGVPQTFGRWRQYREARVNRDGLSPEKEKKPQLLKLTDPANLKPEAPKMIQAAAKMKNDQDLAPQKLKALRYICSIGCSCYNKKSADMVTNALMEAMEDCTLSVRKAAIQAVLANASGQSPCSCSAEGPSCNAKSCCSPKLQKLLKKIAFDMDDNGCYFEPDASVRSMAEQALNLCPPIKEDSGSEVEEPENLGGKDEEGGIDEENKKKKEDEESDDEQARYSRSPFEFASSRRNHTAEQEFLSKLEITGRVTSVQLLEGQAVIKFDKPYEFPNGLNLVVATGLTQASLGVITESKTGQATIIVEDYEFLNELKSSARVRMGVYE